MTDQEARDDEREALDYVIALNEHAEEQFSRGVESAHGYDEESFIAGVRWALARKRPEPEVEYVKGGVCLLCGGAVMNDGSHLDPERHAEEVDLITSGRKHPEPEWEYSAGYEGDSPTGRKWFALDSEYWIREAAESVVARYEDPQVKLVRRTRPGPWEPVEAAKEADR